MSFMKNQKLSLMEKKAKKKSKKKEKKGKEMANTKRPIYCNMRVMSCLV